LLGHYWVVFSEVTLLSNQLAPCASALAVEINRQTAAAMATNTSFCFLNITISLYKRGMKVLPRYRP
jgi:hypothetical protein